MMRRSIALLLIVAAVAGGGVVLATRDSAPSTATAATETPPATARVERRDLVERTSFSGTLGYGGASTLGVAARGTVTALPPLGAVIGRGGEVARVDDRPVIAFFGDVPMWRTLEAGARGADVAQLEANLVAQGFATDGELGDDRFDQRTAAAVKRWQKALGVDETGVVTPADVLFVGGPRRVAAYRTDKGAMVAGPLLDVTGTERVITLKVDAIKQGALRVGDAVEAVLPDERVVPARITEVSNVAVEEPSSTGGKGVARLTVLAKLDRADATAFDQAPVTIRSVRVVSKQAIAVPLRALVALAEGGFALERAADRTLIRVGVGASSDGYVQVEGDISEGDVVVIAP